MITIRYDDGTLQISHRWVSPIQVDASLVELTRQYFGNGKNTKMSQRLISRRNRKLVRECVSEFRTLICIAYITYK